MTRLKILASLVILVLVQGILAAQVTDEAALRRLETVWNHAHVHGDAEALDRLWADDLEVAVPRMAVMTKAQVLAFARSGKMVFQKYETSNLHIRLYGNSAVVTGRLERSRSMNGKQLDDDWRFTKVYVRKGSEWKVVSFHASDAAKP